MFFSSCSFFALASISSATSKVSRVSPASSLAVLLLPLLISFLLLIFLEILPKMRVGVVDEEELTNKSIDERK